MVISVLVSCLLPYLPVISFLTCKVFELEPLKSSTMSLSVVFTNVTYTLGSHTAYNKSLLFRPILIIPSAATAGTKGLPVERFIGSWLLSKPIS